MHSVSKQCRTCQTSHSVASDLVLHCLPVYIGLHGLNKQNANVYPLSRIKAITVLNSNPGIVKLISYA